MKPKPRTTVVEYASFSMAQRIMIFVVLGCLTASMGYLSFSMLTSGSVSVLLAIMPLYTYITAVSAFLWLLNLVAIGRELVKWVKHKK